MTPWRFQGARLNQSRSANVPSRRYFVDGGADAGGGDAAALPAVAAAGAGAAEAAA
jgi:hypothetical protein